MRYDTRDSPPPKGKRPEPPVGKLIPANRRNITATQIVNALRKIKSTMSNDGWDEYKLRIIDGAEGKDDW